MSVGRVGPPGSAPAGVRRPAGLGFTVATPGAAAVAGPAAAPAVGLDGLLALQQAEGDAVRDRQARRHGQSLLDALARMQRALLGDGDDAAALADVVAFAHSVPAAATPALASALAAVALRAKVELARRGL